MNLKAKACRMVCYLNTEAQRKICRRSGFCDYGKKALAKLEAEKQNKKGKMKNEKVI